MQRCAAVLLCLSIFLAPARSQSVDWNGVHAMTMRGIDELYNLNVDDARATFDSVRHAAPADPRGHFFGAIVHFWLFSLTRNETEFNEFLQRSDDVIAVCENLLDANENDPITRFYLGGIHGYRGMAYQLNSSMFKAVVEGRKGYGYLREAVAQKPDLYDAQMGFGLFNYFAGKVPRGFGWLISLLGFDGDVEGGLKMLRAAADSGLYTRAEASLYLSQFLFNEGKRDEAFSRLTRLVDRYPDNTLFLLTLAGWHSRMGNTEEALAAARRAQAINERKKFRYGEEFAFSTLGGVYYLMNDFPEARKNYELFVAKVQNKGYISNTIYYRLAITQEATGDRERAVETFGKISQSSDKERPREGYLYRLAQERIRRPLTESDILTVRGENEGTRKHYDEARALLNDAVAKSFGDPDGQASALYAIQGICFDREQYGESIETGLRLVRLSPPRESWLVPHGYYRLGRAYAKIGRTDDARMAFEKVKDFSDYEFRSSLEDRVDDELSRLNKGP
jgi:tetratricopeptide (TPR) repeat protein